VTLLGVDELCRERRAFMATIESLSDEDFENGRTLCAEWAPRDVLGHLLGTSDIALYVRHGMIV